MQFNENGTIKAHVADNGVRATTMSQGSRDMAASRPATTNKVFDSEADRVVTIGRIKDECAVITGECLEVQSKLADLSARVKGRKFNDPFVRALAADRVKLVKRLTNILARKSEAKRRLSEVSESTSLDKIELQKIKRSDAEWRDEVYNLLSEVAQRMGRIEKRLDSLQ